MTYHTEVSKELLSFQSQLSMVLKQKLFCSPKTLTIVDILETRLFAILFQIPRIASSSNLHLDEDVNHGLTSAFQLFKDTCTDCSTGAIDMESMKSILKYENTFLILFDIVNPGMTDKMKGLLARRLLEVKAYDNEKQINENMVNVCRFLEHISVTEVEQKLETLLREITLKDVCEPAMLETYNSQDATKVQCTYFQHPKEVQDMLQPLFIVFLTSLYRHHLQKRVETVRGEHKKETLSLTDLATLIWKPVHMDLRQLGEGIVNGNVSLKKLEYYLGHTRGDSDDKCRADIAQLFKLYVINQENLVEERSQQIMRYFSLTNISETAKKILGLKETFKLTGDFYLLDRLRNLSSGGVGNETLVSIDEDIIEYAQILDKIQSEKLLDGLEELCEEDSLELTTWIRQEIGDIFELEVFVDLCAEDTSPEFETVLKFHHAVRGHAPYIWDLHKDQSLNNFLEVIRKISEANRKDQHLLAQWQDTKKNLSTLKQVKEAMDSSPLQQAEMINRRGVYSIGKLNNTDQIQHEESSTLVLQIKDPAYGDKIYTLPDLKDLQSKLSLIVGKSQQDAKGGRVQLEYFTQVFSAMQRLAEMYTQLCAAGNTLFLNWTATFVCGSHDGVQYTVCMDFGVGDGCKMYGNRPLKDELACLLEFMEKCLAKWHDRVTEKRGKYYYLNYFTTEQLLRLCRDLAGRVNQRTMETSDEPVQLYALLSHLCPSTGWDSMQQSLQASMASATKDILEDQMTDSSKNPDIQAAEKRNCSMLAARIADDNGLSEALVLAAIHELGTEMEDDAEYVTWCMDHPAGGKNEAPIHSVTQSWKQIVTDLLKEIGTESRPLDVRLTILWEKYLESTKCVDSEEYLSLDYLGRILKHLAIKEDIDSVTAERKLPTYLKETQPNLVVSSARDVLRTVLAIYMYDNHDNGPLPTNEEVLVCTKTTSLEEVCLFWRRAIGDTSRKRIFCLVNAERLEYHISEKAGNLLQDILQRCTGGCRLVVICSREEEHNSHMVTKLDQFRTDLPTEIIKQLGVSKYIFEELKRRASSSERSAAHVTDLRSTAVAVISKGAGSGKSTLVQQYAEDLRKLNQLDTTMSTSICTTIPLHDVYVNNEDVVKTLLPYSKGPSDSVPHIYHIDVAPMVQYGLDDLLFNLLVLGGLKNKHGYVWKSRSQDLYIVEITDLNLEYQQDQIQTTSEFPWFHTLLPHVICRSPKEVLKELRLDPLNASAHTSEILEHPTQQPSNNVPDSRASTEFTDAWQDWDPRINETKFSEPAIQCAFRYLYHFNANHDLNEYNFQEDEDVYDDNVQILQALLANCGVENQDPSWSELCHFASFLSAQLFDCETCDFISPATVQAYTRLSSFKKFVVRFMMLMAKDFSTPSLVVSETTVTGRRLTKTKSQHSISTTPDKSSPPESLQANRSTPPQATIQPHEQREDLGPSSLQSIQSQAGGVFYQIPPARPHISQVSRDDDESMFSLQDSVPQTTSKPQDEDLSAFTLKRRWEESLHPYLFFNDDRHTFTFIGFVIDSNLCLKDHRTETYHPTPIMDFRLKVALEHQGVRFDQTFEQMYTDRCVYENLSARRPMDRLQAIAKVLGIPDVQDPDDSYKLTADNVMKILAITMRFRCHIPVVIMGETGCGKTRLIRFMCQLLASKKPKDTEEEIKNMILMKIHGGTTATDIADKVREAEVTARRYKEQYDVDTVLFFDEANTTEAIGLIKEIMCDGRIQGRPMSTLGSGALKLIASCNPYRRHSPQMLQRMQSTGLGYHVQSNEVKERLGSIPLRELVYRVHPLPPSMRPLVWDFGHLSASVEKKYIKQIVDEYVSKFAFIFQYTTISFIYNL
ncbi:E3 ubiquitin-protein ligase rnf213-alpha-like [Amphiura filiformis]|uniref:E3 ubiquitin-protein ligase rnf213-alpha-like n=1 Tax=Amphiura filiformis TaxID=82378 RepID=UPI003B2131E0